MYLLRFFNLIFKFNIFTRVREWRAY